jgi:hypothetical protein
VSFRDWNPFDLAARSRRNRAAWGIVEDADQAASAAPVSQQRAEVVDTDPVSASAHEQWKRREARAPRGALERDVQPTVLAFLQIHPRVAWVVRMNTGVAEFGNNDGLPVRRVRFAFPGCSDIIGQLRDGRFLAVECKREVGGSVTEEQEAFLRNVNRYGGCAFIARGVEDCVRALG